MNTSLADYLKAIAPRLHPALISLQSLSEIQRLAQILTVPTEASFECRLSNDSSRADFHAGFTHPAINLPKHLLIHPAWRDCHFFCQNWSNPTSILNHLINNLILEFDLSETSAVHIPSLFLGLKAETPHKVNDQVIGILSFFQHPLEVLVSPALQRCIDTLPAGSRIAHMGIMLARPTEGLRLILKDISPQQLPEYLNQVGWIDLDNSLAPLLDTLSPFIDCIALALEVKDTVHPKLGLECFLDHPFHDELRWQQLLDYLVAKELCTPIKRAALLAWPGLTQKADYPELWPANLAFGDLLLGSSAYSVFYRRINHLKITYEPGKPLSAKAYLVFGHRWISATENNSDTKPESFV